jgi:hypothetical protein
MSATNIMSDILCELYILCEQMGLDPELDNSGDHLNFPVALTSQRALVYAQILNQLPLLPKVLQFWITPSLEPSDLESLLPLCEKFVYYDTWPRSLSQWLTHQVKAEVSYPHIHSLKMNNLMNILTPKDLISLQRVFPGLTFLEYDVGVEPGDVFVCNEDDLRTAFDKEILNPFNRFGSWRT